MAKIMLASRQICVSDLIFVGLLLAAHVHLCGATDHSTPGQPLVQPRQVHFILTSKEHVSLESLFPMLLLLLLLLLPPLPLLLLLLLLLLPSPLLPLPAGLRRRRGIGGRSAPRAAG